MLRAKKYQGKNDQFLPSGILQSRIDRYTQVAVQFDKVKAGVCDRFRSWAGVERCLGRVRGKEVKRRR